jgi:hypothetical protein
LFYQFLNDFHLKSLPVVCAGATMTNDDRDGADIAITITSLELVDAARCSWEQILEFRRDTEARDKLRRLRLFACDNYSGKTKDYIGDDILKRIADYQETVRRWGFETKYSALSMLLTSKLLAGSLTGSLVSVLFDAPVAAIASAAGGAGLEIGRIALELSKRKFALRTMLADNPVSYISYANRLLNNA